MAAQGYKATTLNATQKAILTSAIREMKKAQEEKVAATSLYGTGPFTASQLIELQRQIAIHYHLVYKVPLPSGLLFDISNSIQQRSACKSSNTTSVRIERPKQGFTKDMLDSEPGRCRRTDGKKWRCSIDVFQNKKYCERHIKRSRNHASKSAKVNVNGENAASGSSLERSGLSNKLPINKVMNQGLNAASGSSLERSGLSNKLPINNVINQGLNAASGSSLERFGLSNKLPINNLINQGLNAASGSSLERSGLSNKLPINNVINQGLNAASGSSLEGSGLSNKLWINEVTQQGLDTFPLNKANAGGETEDPELLFDDLPDLDFGIPSTDSVMDASQLYQNQNSDYSIESFDYLFPLDEQQTENQNQESLLPFPFPSLHDNLLLTPSWSSGQFLPIQVDSGVADVLNVPTGDQSNISPFSSGSSSGGPHGEILESYKGTQNL